jgi:hypothetical protein
VPALGAVLASLAASAGSWTQSTMAGFATGTPTDVDLSDPSGAVTALAMTTDWWDPAWSYRFRVDLSTGALALTDGVTLRTTGTRSVSAVDTAVGTLLGVESGIEVVREPTKYIVGCGCRLGNETPLLLALIALVCRRRRNAQAVAGGSARRRTT